MCTCLFHLHASVCKEEYSYTLFRLSTLFLTIKPVYKQSLEFSGKYNEANLW